MTRSLYISCLTNWVTVLLDGRRLTGSRRVADRTDRWGGWLCFVVSISCIGALTAVIGDVASAFGCSVGLLDSVTAIAFVALGTSVPGQTRAQPIATFFVRFFIKIFYFSLRPSEWLSSLFAASFTFFTLFFFLSDQFQFELNRIENGIGGFSSVPRIVHKSALDRCRRWRRGANGARSAIDPASRDAAEWAIIQTAAGALLATANTASGALIQCESFVRYQAMENAIGHR